MGSIKENKLELKKAVLLADASVELLDVWWGRSKVAYLG